VAADIVRTVVLDQTLNSVLTLGVLVLVRTLLSWSVIVEIEGRWPWRAAELDAARTPSAERTAVRKSE
jgi:hypothetical protein